MKRFLVSSVLALLMVASPLSRADFSLPYPRGEAAFAIHIGNIGIAFLFWDLPHTGDLYALHADFSADPLDASLAGAPSGRGYWLQFKGRDAGGHLHFDLFVNTDGSSSGWVGPTGEFVI